jgi:hypothetical protein
MYLERDTIAQVTRKLFFEDGCDFWKILNNDLEVRECSREDCVVVTSGAAELVLY